MMTTFFKAFAIAAAFSFSTVSANDFAKDYLDEFSNEFTPSLVEKTYIKCTVNENGERVPNYFVVVEGVAFKTDAKTFFDIKKAKNEQKKDLASVEVGKGEAKKCL